MGIRLWNSWIPYEINSRRIDCGMEKTEALIKFFILAGDTQVTNAFHLYQKPYRDIIEKRLVGKKYAESLNMILIEYHLEGKYHLFPEKPIRLLNYTLKSRSIAIVIGVSRDFGSWLEGKKRSFLVSTTTTVVELVKERMDHKGLTDIDFNRLLADLETCSNEYLAMPKLVEIDKLPTVWDFMEKGQYELAYIRMTEEMLRNPEYEHRNNGNLAHCLLLLGRPEEALVYFQKMINLQPTSVSGYIGAGIAFWWMDRINDAVEVWKQALPAIYTDAAGGVEVPAFLTFAAIMMSDRTLEKYSRSLLEKKWKTKRVAVWPGPIAGYLLGKINADVLMSYSMIGNSILKERRLTQIHFWIALNNYHYGNNKEYQKHLKQSSLGNIIEPEYYLAKWEINKMREPITPC